MIMSEVYPPSQYQYGNDGVNGYDHSPSGGNPGGPGTGSEEMDMLKSGNPDKKTRFAPAPTHHGGPSSPAHQQAYGSASMYNNTQNGFAGQQNQQQQNNMVAMAAMLGQMQQQQAGQVAGYGQLLGQNGINGMGINTSLAGLNGYGQQVCPT